jgi:hypothetical protein
MATELHTTVRFAWQRKDSPNFTFTLVRWRFTHPLNLILVAFNLLWLVSIFLPFTKIIDYRTGFILFFAVTIIRLVANLIRNNVLKPEQADNFPLRMGSRLGGLSDHM